MDSFDTADEGKLILKSKVREVVVVPLISGFLSGMIATLFAAYRSRKD